MPRALAPGTQTPISYSLFDKIHLLCSAFASCTRLNGDWRGEPPLQGIRFTFTDSELREHLETIFYVIIPHTNAPFSPLLGIYDSDLIR